VYIEIEDKRGAKTGQIKLQPATGTVFERGSTHHFAIQTRNLGDLASLEVWMTGSCFSPANDWALEWISVQALPSGNAAGPVWYFSFADWIRPSLKRFRCASQQTQRPVPQLKNGVLHSD